MPTEIKQKVWENIKFLRVQKGLTQKVVAKRAGLHLKSYERIERSPQNLTLEHLESLAGALEVSISDLLGTASPPSFKKSKVRYKPSEAIDYAVEILELFKKDMD